MVRTFTCFWAFVVATLLSGCATPRQRLPYHFSGDFQTQVLYLSPLVAIEKYLTVYSDGNTKTFFTVGRAHREESELAADTGDRFDESVKGTIKRVGTSADRRWLLVDSDDYNLETRKPVAYVTAIALSSGQMYSAGDLSSLAKVVPSGVTSTKLDAVELFFDRTLILRFHDPLK